MQGFSLEQMVGGVLAETRASMQKHASAPDPEPTTTDSGHDEETLADEGEKLASALEYIADCMDEGDLSSEEVPETSLE